MPRLHIYDRRERALVAAADAALAAAAAAVRPFRRRRPVAAPKRILLLRLERIGDLLMTVPAIADVRAYAPDAQIELCVGSWNAVLARAIPGITRVETIDAAWLARDGGGMGLPSLMRAARRWRRVRYDLAINFEPDLRSNMVLAACGAQWTAGYDSGGGGALLDVALSYDIRAHTADNARHLVAAVFGASTSPGDRPETQERSIPRPILTVPPEAREQAARRVAGRAGPMVGVHVSGGRAIKQWDPERFADVAGSLVRATGATIVLTGSSADRPLVERVSRTLPESSVIDVSGDVDLLTLAAILERLDLLITGDTGPMHLAVARGVPVVAVFGPSDPARYAPRGPMDRVVRVDLPCSPCNRIRLPPARCVGHTPDCLALVSVEAVLAAALAVLERSTRRDDVASRTSTA